MHEEESFREGLTHWGQGGVDASRFRDGRVLVTLVSEHGVGLEHGLSGAIEFGVVGLVGLA